jgi:hypothetical protein
VRPLIALSKGSMDHKVYLKFLEGDILPVINEFECENGIENASCQKAKADMDFMGEKRLTR